MTDEERQRQMDFILAQQARFAVDLQTLGESVQTLREAQARTDQQLAMYAETQSEFIQIVTHSIQALADSQLRTDERMLRTDERMAQTDERLNALINIVERHISAGHDNVG